MEAAVTEYKLCSCGGNAPILLAGYRSHGTLKS